MTDPNQYNPQVPQPAPQYGTPDYGQAQAPQYAAPNYNQAPQYGQAPQYAQAPQYGQALSTARLQPRITGSRHRNRSRAIASSH